MAPENGYPDKGLEVKGADKKGADKIGSRESGFRRQRFSVNSIRTRMTVAFALSIALLLLFACSGMSWYARHVAERNADNLLNGIAQIVVPNLTNEEHRLDRYELDEMEREDLRPNGMALLIVDKQGNILQQSQGHVPEWPRRREDGWRVVVVEADTETVVIGQPWGRTERMLQSQNRMLIAVSMGAIAVAAIGAWLLVGWTLSPIGRLTQQAQAASGDNFHVRLSAPSQDAEIVSLVSTLNGLLARQAETVATRGRFYAAASHELRTPLQALSGHLELAIQRERTAEEYARVVEEAHTQTGRLSSLVRDLLLLNQLEAAPLPQRVPVDIAELCQKVLENSAPLIEARHLNLRTIFPSEASFTAPPNHAEMLVRNLIENALKYANEGGIVQVRIESAAGTVALSIFDACPPLPDWNPEKLFEPFYRPDASRNSKTGGNGLGLAICRAIADANGWQVKLSQQPDGVLVQVLFLDS